MVGQNLSLEFVLIESQAYPDGMASQNDDLQSSNKKVVRLNCRKFPLERLRLRLRRNREFQNAGLTQSRLSL